MHCGTLCFLTVVTVVLYKFQYLDIVMRPPKAVFTLQNDYMPVVVVTYHKGTSNMEKFKNMTDDELITTLRKYGIQHGPIVGTTRTLYEKKLIEYESEKHKFPVSTRSYESSQYSRREYKDDDDDKQTYEEYTKTYHYPAYQRPKEDLQNRSYSSKVNTYQNISQSSYSQGVEPRRPIRPKQKEETPVKRFIPLWLQLLLLLLITGFLVYVYILQTDENPFKLADGSQ